MDEPISSSVQIIRGYKGLRQSTIPTPSSLSGTPLSLLRHEWWELCIDFKQMSVIINTYFSVTLKYQPLCLGMSLGVCHGRSG